MKLNPVIALIVANIVWGAAVPIFKYSLQDIPPFTFLFIRFLFSALIFVPALKNFKVSQLSRYEWFTLLVGTMIGFPIHVGLLFLGLEKTDSINAPVITSASPLFLFILSVFILHEKFNKKVLFGMIVAMLGVLVIIVAPLLVTKNNVNGLQVEGNLLYLASAITNVFSIIILKKISNKISPQFLTFFVFVISALAFLPFMLHELQIWSFSSMTMGSFGGLLYGIFLSSALAYYLYFYGLSKISSQEIGVFSYVDPIAAVLIAMPLLHEFPDLYFCIGSVLVFGGIFIAEERLQYHPLHRVKKYIQRQSK